MTGAAELIKSLKELTAKLEEELLATPKGGRGNDTACDRELALQAAVLAVRLYAETHPRPSQVTRIQAAEMLGLSRVTVSKLIRFGTLKLNACGLIPITEIDRAIACRP